MILTLFNLVSGLKSIVCALSQNCVQLKYRGNWLSKVACLILILTLSDNSRLVSQSSKLSLCYIRGYWLSKVASYHHCICHLFSCQIIPKSILENYQENRTFGIHPFIQKINPTKISVKIKKES